jgi:hypothetical protein
MNNRVKMPVDTEIKRLRRYDSYLTGGVIVAILIGLGAVVGFAIWISVSQTSQNNAIRTNANSITQLNMEVMQLFIETANLTSTTVLQSGTFEWVITETGTSSTNCFDSSLYLNTPQVTFNGTYELQSVTIGSLDFTILVISPPIEGPLVSQQAVTDLQICLIRFTPAIAALDDIGLHSEANQFVFTHANVNRLTATPNCLASEECYISNGPVEAFPERDSYRIGTRQPIPTPGDGFINYHYLTTGVGFFPVPQSVTLSSAFQLMIFQS